MADTYAILGFANDMESPVVLYTSESCLDCDFFKRVYTQGGCLNSWGGYEVLALYEIAPYESVDTIHKTDTPVKTWERESI